MDDYFKLGSAAFLLLMQDDRVLLQLRQGTGYADGLYGLVGGHIDGQEPVTAALIREAREEAGVNIDAQDLHFSCVMHRRAGPELEFISFFFTCNNWSGGLRNAEPEYCTELNFFARDQLPQNTIPWVQEIMAKIEAKQFYYEQGW